MPRLQWPVKNMVKAHLDDVKQKSVDNMSGNWGKNHHLGVSMNGGTPKWMIYKGKSH